MKTLFVMLTVLGTAACAGTGGLPTSPTGVVGDTLTFGSHGNLRPRLRVVVQVGASLNDASVFLTGVEVTIETDVGTFSGVTAKKGAVEVTLPGTAAGRTALIRLAMAGCEPVTARVELSEKPRQLFQFAMPCE